MVDSRSKGQRGEYLVRDILRCYTDLPFERVPASGALPYLKGDLFVPNKENNFCIEVKNYAESPFTDKIFTKEKTSQLVNWWKKIKNQADNCNKKPLLFFKYNYSRVFVVTDLKPEAVERYSYLGWLNCYVMLAEDWLAAEDVEFIS